MNKYEYDVKYIELKFQDNISLRNYYHLVIIGVTGGIIGLLYNLTILNFILFFIGIFIDYIFIIKAYNISKENYFLMNKVKEFKNGNYTNN